jgi:hypothetical protein
MEEEAAGQRGEQTELRPAVCAWSQDGHHGRAPRGKYQQDKGQVGDSQAEGLGHGLLSASMAPSSQHPRPRAHKAPHSA